jgi:hypothetical protein
VDRFRGGLIYVLLALGEELLGAGKQVHGLIGLDVLQVLEHAAPVLEGSLGVFLLHLFVLLLLALGCHGLVQ